MAEIRTDPSLGSAGGRGGPGGVPGEVRLSSERSAAGYAGGCEQRTGTGHFYSGSPDGRGQNRGCAGSSGGSGTALRGGRYLLWSADPGHRQRYFWAAAGLGAETVGRAGTLHPAGARHGAAEYRLFEIAAGTGAGEKHRRRPGGTGDGAPVVSGQQTGASGQLCHWHGGSAADGGLAAEACDAAASRPGGQGGGDRRVSCLRRLHELLSGPGTELAGRVPGAGDPAFGHTARQAAHRTCDRISQPENAAGCTLENLPRLPAADLDR